MELDVLPDALAMPVSLTGIDTADREAFVSWLLQEFDVDPAAARAILPERLLGLLVATPEGWIGRVWSGASLAEKQGMLDKLCAHGALGDLRGESGDWWWFPHTLQPEVLGIPPDEKGFISPELRVQERLTDQLLTGEDPTSLLAGPGLSRLEAMAERLRIPFVTALFWAARHSSQPLWIQTQAHLPEIWWANGPAQDLNERPELAIGTAIVNTHQGWATYERLEVQGIHTILSRPAPRLREHLSTDLTELLPFATALDWITAADFNDSVLQNLLPTLDRVLARVVLCLERPEELEGFFVRLNQALESTSTSTRKILNQARSTGHLQLRLGVGLSPKYQIALLEDAYQESIYYYAALNQPVRLLTSWEGDVEQYRKKFENLWQTAADQRIQLIDLYDLLEQYGC